jgi:membrane associated rhomboid family serine protease
MADEAEPAPLASARRSAPPSDNRLQRLQSKLQRVENSLAVFDSALAAECTEASARILTDLRPGLSDAVPRLRTIMESRRLGSMDDAAACGVREHVSTLQAHLTRSLRAHEDMHAATATAAAPLPLNVAVPITMLAPPPIIAPSDDGNDDGGDDDDNGDDDDEGDDVGEQVLEMEAADGAVSAWRWPWAGGRRRAQISVNAVAATTAAAAASASRPAPSFANRPYFCAVVISGCFVVLLLEIEANGWKVQPLVCDASLGAGCEANWMLGPRKAVLDAMGAKNDVAIFERGEWWRLLTCGWLHAGILHWLLNVAGVLALGVGVERAFGWWRTAVIYLLSALAGALASALFLPGVLSVGASGGVFGLIGAYVRNRSIESMPGRHVHLCEPPCSLLP